MNIANFIRDWCTDLYGHPPNSFERMVYYKILRKFGFTGRRFETESGPLHRASFEETTAQLTSASLFSEVDPMTGVSANIMFGQFIQTGTNAFRIGLDLDRLKKQKVPEQPLVLQQRQTTQVVEPLDLTQLCLPENFEFDFKLGGVAPQ